MGFSGLARWVNAPTTGLELIKQNIVRNHAGIERGRWFLSVKSYRSHLSQPRFHAPSFTVAERTLCALTMGPNVFALLEDPAAPTRADFTHMVAQSQSQAATEIAPSSSMSSSQTSSLTFGNARQTSFMEPLHYRSTFITVTPPGALEALLTMLGAPWQSSRHVTAPGMQAPNSVISSGQQLVIDGIIFSIGTDWLIRVGNVILSGGTMKGMLLEAEYLPLPKMRSSSADGSSELLSNILISILPNTKDATIVGVTIADFQWEEVTWNQTDFSEHSEDMEFDDSKRKEDDDDLFVYDDEEDTSKRRNGDWTGVERDRRSAFLIIGALRSEGIL